MKTKRILIVVVSMSSLAVAVFAQDNTMTPEQADRILARAGETQPSYISPEQAARIFHYNGKITIEEDAQYGDTNDVSRIAIKPIDNSFDHIGIQITRAGILFADIDAAAKSWTPHIGQELNPFVSIQFPDGAKGYYDGYGHAVLSSFDGQFDIGIEIAISENGRDPIETTNSNKELVKRLMDKGDHGFKFLTEVMTKIYPLAKHKYRDQTTARALLMQAQKIIQHYSTLDDSQSTRLARISASSSISKTAATADQIPSPIIAAVHKSYRWLLAITLTVLVMGAIGWFVLRRRKKE